MMTGAASAAADTRDWHWMANASRRDRKIANKILLPGLHFYDTFFYNNVHQIAHLTRQTVRSCQIMVNITSASCTNKFR